ncbi:Lysophospholipase [Klebsormidium nitens]|uniref:Lysophospholipase n=1 Tax=Klebsormidium nitens TaxID=105231 RepID=A0A1Y1HRD6_KLENI|nr:Lysophospholipase [Klebsormidium nitens]|eukprot:GAQ80653.1 Lysophospholipase [Klebsormidium nitens]
MYRQLQPPPFKDGSRLGAAKSPTYGLFLNAGQGGFTRDGKFRKSSSFSPPVRAASSGALPIPPEGDENVIRPIDAFEGLLGVAGAAPRDASDRRGDAEVSGDVSKEEVRRKGRAVAGVNQGRLVEAWEIADPDSRFAEYRKVYIHYKIAMPGGASWTPVSGSSASGAERDAQGKLVRTIDRLGGSNSGASNSPESVSEAQGRNEIEEASTSGRPAFPTILLHGFGASLFSWERVLQPVAELAGGPALAFDRPAFGLSARVEPKNLPLNPYSEKFSAAATLAFVDFLGGKKAVLLAHSAGCVVALTSYFQAPEKIAAIILVAPAIFPKAGKPSEPQLEPAESASGPQVPFWQLPFVWIKRAAAAVISAVKWVVRQFRRGLGILGLALAAIVVRSRAATWALRLILDRVGEAGVKSAWFDPEACTQDVLDAYKKPLKVRGWERGLLEFVLATMGGSPGSELPLGHRLSEVTCPVLVVTGDSDRLVPTWNSKRVAEALPRAQLRVIERCGHLPQEEKPQELLSAIRDFLRDQFENSGEQSPSRTF